MKKFIYILFFIQSLHSFAQHPFQKITGSTATLTNARFGTNVAIDDTLAFVIAQKDSITNSPGAYFYKKINGVWTEEQIESNPGTFPLFGVGESYATSGSCIALEGNQAFIGSLYWFNGEVFVYTYNGTTWSLTQTITNSAPFFGRSLHVDGNLMVVNSSKDSYLYEFDGTNWIQKEVIADVGVNFGSQAFVSGNHILISDAGDSSLFHNYYNSNSYDNGAVYAYQYSAGVLSSPQKITFLTNDSASAFGTAVFAENNRMVISAPSGSENNTSSKVFIYDFNGTNWQFSDTIKPSSIGLNDRFFGSALALIGGKIVVGQNEYSNTTGKAYLFEHNGSTWVESNLTPSDIAYGDYHGRKISSDGKHIIINSFGDDDNGSNSGSVYIFDFCPSQGPSQNYSICSGDSVLIGSTYFYTDTIYNQVFLNANAQGCDSSIIHTVVVNSLPSVIANTSNTSICNGESVQLTGSGALSYSWNNGVTDGSSVSPSITTTYEVIGVDANNCQNSDQVTITVNSLPTVNANSSLASICAGTQITLFGSGNATSYSWNNGVTDGDSIAPSTTTTYEVIGVDANSCQNSDQITITVNPLPTVNANSSSTSVCAGSQVTLFGTGNATMYFWNNSVTNGQAFTPSTTKTYIVTGSDGLCVNTDQITITVNPIPTVSLAAFNPATICLNNNPVILPIGSPSGGTYSGAGVAGNNFDPSISGVGTFSIAYTYTDGLSCTNSTTTDITVNLCTGIESNSNNEKMIVSPNPFNNYINLIGLSGELSTISIIDMSGKLIKTISTQQADISISTEQLSSGVYFIKVVSNENIITQKIIKY